MVSVRQSWTGFCFFWIKSPVRLQFVLRQIPGCINTNCLQECGTIAQIQKETVEPTQINVTLVTVQGWFVWLKVKLLHVWFTSVFIWLSSSKHLGLIQRVTFCVRMRQRLSGINTSASFEMMKVTTNATAFITAYPKGGGQGLAVGCSTAKILEVWGFVSLKLTK